MHPTDLESRVGLLIERARDTVLPWWVKWPALAALLACAFVMGMLHEARRSADQQGATVVTLVKKQVQVVTKVGTKYRDRIQKIYVQGGQLEQAIPTIVTPDVDRQFPLSAGFVRVLDAAWAGAAAGSSRDSDREPSPVPSSIVAANESDNATSCRAWREQAIGWREFYAGQQRALNGKTGDWYKPDATQINPPEKGSNP